MADKPVTREEKYLAYLTGDYKGELPKPITRKEKYLYELCLKGIGGEISPEEIKNAVNEYLENNPVKPGATAEQAQQIEQNKTDISSLKVETSSLKEDMNDLATFERYPNLITNYDILENTILNNVGSTESNNSYATFKYGVPVKSGKKYYLSHNGNHVIAKIIFTTTASTSSFVTPIEILNNVSGGVCPQNATYIQISVFTSGGVNANNVILQESETYREDSVIIKNNVQIPKLDEIDNKVNEIDNKVKKDLFINREELKNKQLNTVGWTENADGFSTNKVGVKVKPNTWYTVVNNLSDETIEAKYITEKTADDILNYAQSTFIKRTSSPRMILTSETTEYLFITVTNKNFMNVGIVEGFSKYMPISKTLWTNGKKLMTLGDSLTAFGGWQPYVLGKLGFANYVNLGVGGSKVNVFADNVTAENIKDVDVITIMGFFNSTSSQPGTIEDEASNSVSASICANYKYLIDKLLTLKPTVNIILMTPHTPRADDVKLKAEAVKSVAILYHIPCIDLYNEGGFNSYTFDSYLMDAVHSSELGYVQESKVICGKMQQYLS